MYHYEHGGDIIGAEAGHPGKSFCDYSANINPLGLPPEVRQALSKCWKDCEHYPDPFCRGLVRDLAAFLQVSPENILCGNGAADLLFRLALAERPKRTLLLAPSFSDYEKAAAAVGSKVDLYPLEETQDFCLDKNFLKAVNKRVEMVILCNPNNPTGQVIAKPLLIQILQKCQTMGIRLLVDECFLDFVEGGQDYSLIPELKNFSRLVILKAFTKTYAMPGLRLGYCLTSDGRLLEQMRQSSQDWSVSVPAQAAGRAALTSGDYVDRARALISKERHYLGKELAALGFKVYPGRANYLLCHWSGKMPWPELLQKRGFLIRDCSNYHNLAAGYYRLAVKKRTDNRILIKNIKEIIRYAISNDID